MANIGSTDKKLRLLGGVVLIIFSFVALGGPSTPIGILAIIVGAVSILTALVNFCPAYKLFGITTVPKSKPDA